jgi:hypothetical protein
VRSVRFALALMVTFWAGWETFERLMGDSGWQVVAALVGGGVVGAWVFTALNDGPRALVDAVARGRAARR